jgi:hypothetical protein
MRALDKRKEDAELLGTLWESTPQLLPMAIQCHTLRLWVPSPLKGLGSSAVARRQKERLRHMAKEVPKEQLATGLGPNFRSFQGFFRESICITTVLGLRLKIWRFSNSNPKTPCYQPIGVIYTFFLK